MDKKLFSHFKLQSLNTKHMIAWLSALLLVQSKGTILLTTEGMLPMPQGIQAVKEFKT